MTVIPQTDVILWSNTHPSPNHGPLANPDDVVLNVAGMSIGSAVDTLAPDIFYLNVRNAPIGPPMHNTGDHADSAGPLSRVTRRGSFVLKRIP